MEKIKKSQESVKVSREVLDKLRRLKLDWNCKSVDAVIIRLFKIGEIK